MGRHLRIQPQLRVVAYLMIVSGYGTHRCRDLSAEVHVPMSMPITRTPAYISVYRVVSNPRFVGEHHRFLRMTYLMMGMRYTQRM